ncbi:hypothetical protein [Maribacter sp. 4G9]|uniref:hypothetical protein n=1 Tax=Maribacter sp. 4G9 TaxID=1889777 RepID=UPI000C147C4E|nr:hypothetical protein [Maribacter sp. 4G9]PIB30596.1 hypothetical protein BFP75_02350 [Maribacter sp. 4G9]
MKILKFSLLLFIAAATFISCSKDDNDEGGTSDTFIKFTAEGTNYNFSDIITAEGSNITFNGNNGSSLMDPGDMQISVWVPKTYEEGTHAITDDFAADYTIAFTADALGYDFDFAEEGSIVITQKTAEYVEGTFSATVISGDDATKSIVISNGSFRALTIQE